MINHHALTGSIAAQRRTDLERQAHRARLSRDLRRQARTARAPTRRPPVPADVTALDAAAAA
jgi:hypothetical protein